MTADLGSAPIVAGFCACGEGLGCPGAELADPVEDHDGEALDALTTNNPEENHG